MTKKLEIVYVVPSRYDDDGYVQRYFRGIVPSNSLAVLKSLTANISLADTEINVTCYDDCVEHVPLRKIARLAKKPDTKVVVGLVGVQSGQFPRAADLAMRLKKLGVPCMIGGFHVSGVLELFDEVPSEIQSLLDNDISIIRGECETPGCLETLFQDVLDGNMKPIYHFPKAPDIENVPLPVADPKHLKKYAVKWATIDSSRGCPYGCTFCTVINVQGRKMRCRSAEGVLKAIEKNQSLGVKHFFFTDDNFARSRIWEKVFDGLIQMRSHGKKFSFMMQIDTQSAKIPNFVEKASKAGCRSVFVGMESVNPANIESVGKSQNSVEQYKTFVQSWQNSGVLVHVGYIIGFPHDTMESVKTDVAFLTDHIGVDEASFFMLTPLPGSVDHKNMILRGDAIDPDLNKYDSYHETFQHSKMAKGEWAAATKTAYSQFYSKENIVRILRRIDKKHYWHMFMNFIWYRYSGVYNGTHPMMTGVFRQKDRLDRREGLPTESFLSYCWRRTVDSLKGASYYLKLFWEFQEIWMLTRKSPEPLLPKFLPKTDLCERWLAAKERIAELNWAGQCQTASQELRLYLKSTLQTLNAIIRSCPPEQIKRLKKLASDTAEALGRFEMKPNDISVVLGAQRFVEKKLIAPLEEMSCRYVRTRRRINVWRKNAIRQLKHGHVFRFAWLKTVAQSPFIAVSEAYLALRFGLAALRHE